MHEAKGTVTLQAPPSPPLPSSLIPVAPQAQLRNPDTQERKSWVLEAEGEVQSSFVPCSELHQSKRRSNNFSSCQNSGGMFSLLFPVCSRADCARSPERQPEDFPLGCVVGCLPLQLEDLKWNFQPCAWCCPEAPDAELLELCGTGQHCC